MMKKVFTFFILATIAGSTMAQSVKDIDKFIVLGRWAEADAAVKAFMANPKTSAKPEGWYYRGAVDFTLSNDSALSVSQQLAKKTSSFDAYKKYQMMDDKAPNLAEEKYRPYLLLYAGFYDLGAATFNKKDFNNSFKSFSKALETEEYIVSKGYSYEEIKFAAFDTALILNTAIAASQAKDSISAIKLYSRFLDNSIGGEESMPVYEIVIDHYVKSKDAENANKYIKIAERVFPKNLDLWNEYEVKLIGKENKEALYAQYDKLLALDPNNFNIAYNYAVDLYNSLYAAGETRPADPAATKTKLTSLLKAAIISDKGIEATMLMTNHLFNITAEYSVDETSEKVPAKKIERKKKTIEAANAVIPYAEKVMTYLNAIAQPTSRQNADKKNVLGYLMDVYSLKGDNKKADEYDKLRRDVKIQ